MSSKLIPKNPSAVAVIRNITPNVVTISVPFARFEKVRVGGRGTIIRMTSGTLAVFSPVALTPQAKAKVAEMGGNVGYLIAGDMEHHIFLSEWKKEYPQAKLIGPKGLPEKRAKMTDDKVGKEQFAFVYDASNMHSNAISDEFAADFEVEFVDAHASKEIVLFFKPERVLIEADLMFNLPAIEQYSKVPEAEKKGASLLNKLFETLNTTAGEAKAHKRLQWYALSNGTKNRAGYNESVQRIDSWDWDTLIPCHGETLQGNGKQVFRKIFEWHLRGHK
ncbi:Uu.00g116560.m01.CDS01 [Anthostomella pinea]|uniref:Uu.00g116560.m01.CDS01 n=1 Tax=Anthostomella pinea TaxID=933095 RepID=A0AAI8YGZ7_9PEZI|nr:Uu.00g116560.m01.CDS01 [Anthostomella pinea]